MILEQFYLGCLAHASYLIGDAGVAAVVDPQRDIEQYLEFAEAHGLRIRHVILTHFHADFVAGHIELRDRTGASIYLGAPAKAEYAFTPLHDGDSITFGAVRLRALATPGHTAESISILVFDDTRSLSDPMAVLTGDTLFVGDVGRPDLRVALGWSAAELGGMLYDSLRDKLLGLPDGTLVYPAHGAGSLCGKALGKETFSTIGEQRRSNYALQPMSKQAFIELVTADQPDAPAYFTYDAVLNTKERPTLDAALSRELKALPLEEVLDMQRRQYQIVDTRDFAEFAAVHLKGSLNIPLGGAYATTAGTLLSHEVPIVLITEPGAEPESAMRLGRVGFDHVVGYLAGGLNALDGHPDRLDDTERLSAPVAAARLATAQRPVLLDVRTPAERQEKRIPGSTHIPLNRLPQQLAQLPRDQSMLVYCAGGYRSSVAASLLQNAGFAKVSEIAGGLVAWETAGLPLEPSDGSGSKAD
ncbi:MAG: rhodanese-like domain-containing protein [Vicinamibacterales bacterium]